MDGMLYFITLYLHKKTWCLFDQLFWDIDIFRRYWNHVQQGSVMLRHHFFCADTKDSVIEEFVCVLKFVNVKVVHQKSLYLQICTVLSNALLSRPKNIGHVGLELCVKKCARYEAAEKLYTYILYFCPLAPSSGKRNTAHVQQQRLGDMVLAYKSTFTFGFH